MKKIFFFLVFSFTLSSSVFSQVPPSQTAGGLLQQRRQIEIEKALEEQLRKMRLRRKEQSRFKVTSPEREGEKILIKKIVVENVTLISQDEIEEIVSPFEGKKLSLKDMQKVADLITEAYRKKGYVTSRAYIPPQTIKNAILIIRVVEGKVGKIKIEGNRYFKSHLLEKKINLKPGGYFDYSSLQKSLVYLNQSRDRFVSAILRPGETPGTTDIILKVKDRLPIHIGFEYDNYGSRYIEKDRYSFLFEDNNLLGFDDRLYFRFQKGEYDALTVKQANYIFPVNRTLEVGGYFLRNRIKLTRELKDLDTRGEATVYGVYLNKLLVDRDDLNLGFNFGFDYKNIRNYLGGEESSRDYIRVFKSALDIDYMDKWGRNILSLEVDTGVPEIMGGMRAKDARASRSRAGGKFVKGLVNYFRVQPFFSSYFLWKNFFQFSSYNLVASEQFQIGGPASVRGYPPGEYSGDKGWYTSLEWSVPAYFLPRDKFFLKLYNSLRVVLFYDWATVHLNNPLAGEKKHRTLKGYGVGLRFNPSDNFSLKGEVGYPAGNTPSDNEHAHPWVEFRWKF